MTHCKEVRRNPPSRATRAQYMVLVRRFDKTGESLPRWDPLFLDDDGVTLFSLAAATRAVLSPPADAELQRGDLLGIVHIDAVSDVDNQVRLLYIKGTVRVEEVPCPPAVMQGSWFGVWGHDAILMMNACQSLSRFLDSRRLILALCDCAETVLHLVPKGEDRPRAAIEAVRAWCRRQTPAMASVARKASDAAREAAETLRGSGPAMKPAVIAAQAAWQIMDGFGGLVVRDSILAAKLGDGAGWEAASANLARVIEHWIPLPTAMFAALGYTDWFHLSDYEVRTNPRTTARRRSRR